MARPQVEAGLIALERAGYLLSCAHFGWHVPELAKGVTPANHALRKLRDVPPVSWFRLLDRLLSLALIFALAHP